MIGLPWCAGTGRPPGGRELTGVGIRASTVWHRIYADFLMPARLDEYRRMLESFVRAGYAVISVETFWDLITTGRLNDMRRFVVLRHDIDTDPGTGRRMWEIERDLGVEGSYFFRLSTVDVPLMQEIAAAGSSASYHYEDLATIAKHRRLRTRSEVDAHIAEAQESFRRNLDSLRAITGSPMRVVAAHGDFVNRRLGIPNWVILTDENFRRETGVDLETYDESVMTHVSSRHADSPYPRYWSPENPLAAVARHEPVVYLLVHPRHWRVARAVNARDDFIRLGEGVRYALPRGREAR